MANWLPALTVISPALPVLVLLAEIAARFDSVTDCPALREMLPPAPLASAFENNPLLGPGSVTGPVVLIVRVPPLPKPRLVADIVAPFSSVTDRAFTVMSPPCPFASPVPLINCDPRFTFRED